MINFEQYLAERTGSTVVQLKAKRKVKDREELQRIIASKQSLKDLDISAIRDMSSLFKDNSDFNISEVETWDFSEVEVMDEMFWGCKELKSIKLTNLSKVVSMQGCFSWCSKLKSVELLGTHNLKLMVNTFAYSTKLTTVYIPQMESVTDMLKCFHMCGLLQSMNINSNKLYRLWDCFRGCAKLKEVTISDTTFLNNAEHCFHGCVKLNKVVIPFPKNAQALGYMFYDCKKLDQSFSSWDLKGIKHENMFDKATIILKADGYLPANYK